MELRLPDDRVITVEEGATGLDAAAAIGPGLARAAVAYKLNGELRDLSRPITEGGDFEVITLDSPEGLHILRHSTAHVMAQAVLDLFPGSTFAIGPRPLVVGVLVWSIILIVGLALAVAIGPTVYDGVL